MATQFLNENIFAPNAPVELNVTVLVPGALLLPPHPVIITKKNSAAVKYCVWRKLNIF